MNKTLIIEAFEYAKENGIPFGKEAYYDRETGAMCSVGILALRAGCPKEDMHKNYLSGPGRPWNLFKLELHYTFPNIDVLVIVNDERFNSWDDAIAWVKAL